VQAARFVESVKQDVQEKVEERGTEQGEHPAATLLRNFMGNNPKITLKERTAEISTESDDAVDVAA
jgi:hypothetical protein